MFTIVSENRIKKAANIFKHQSLRFDFPQKANCFRKQVAIIFLSQLFSSNRKRRTGNTSCQEINFTAILLSRKIADISTNDIPFRSIEFQDIAIILFIFNKHFMNKASHCKAKSLSTSPRTNFNTCQHKLSQQIRLRKDNFPSSIVPRNR